MASKLQGRRGRPCSQGALPAASKHATPELPPLSRSSAVPHGIHKVIDTSLRDPSVPLRSLAVHGRQRLYSTRLWRLACCRFCLSTAYSGPGFILLRNGLHMVGACFCLPSHAHNASFCSVLPPCSKVSARSSQSAEVSEHGSIGSAACLANSAHSPLSPGIHHHHRSTASRGPFRAPASCITPVQPSLQLWHAVEHAWFADSEHIIMLPRQGVETGWQGRVQLDPSIGIILILILILILTS